MLGTSGLFTLLSWNVPTSKRVFHIITTLIAIIGTLSYFSMATGHTGNYFSCTSVRDEHGHGIPDTFHEVCRQVYWARYVDWALTTPLLLLELCLLAGIDGAHTLMAILANVIMLLSGLFSAMSHHGTAQKWGWFSIAVVSYLVVIWHVALHGSHMVRAKGSSVAKLFGSLALFLLVLWTAYPM